jgi:hypothetical protein
MRPRDVPPEVRNPIGNALSRALAPERPRPHAPACRHAPCLAALDELELDGRATPSPTNQTPKERGQIGVSSRSDLSKGGGVYARVATFEGDPADIDDAISHVRTEVESRQAPPGLEDAKMLIGLSLTIGLLFDDYPAGLTAQTASSSSNSTLVRKSALVVRRSRPLKKRAPAPSRGSPLRGVVQLRCSRVPLDQARAPPQGGPLVAFLGRLARRSNALLTSAQSGTGT